MAKQFESEVAGLKACVDREKAAREFKEQRADELHL
jgi:hypothetical protein